MQERAAGRQPFPLSAHFPKGAGMPRDKVPGHSLYKKYVGWVA